jgi:hypothetical protein
MTGVFYVWVAIIVVLVVLYHWATNPQLTGFDRLVNPELFDYQKLTLHLVFLSVGLYIGAYYEEYL